MSKPRAPSAAERALFRGAVAGVRRLRDDHVRLESPPQPAYPLQRERDERAALAESLGALPHDLALELALEGGDEESFLRPGLARGILRDLRRGRWTIQGELDLHGATRDEALDQLRNFVDGSRLRGERCLRIIHGKGLGSPGREPVLKGLARAWLTRRQDVLAWCQARPVDGGAGALIVLLQRPTPCRER